MKTFLFICVSIILLINYVDGQTFGNELNIKAKPFVVGSIDSIHSEALSENRIVNVYLPEGYSSNSVKKYPVIYLLDGSANEYFIHVVGLVNFFNLPWINRLPKSIVVGISNTNRSRDMTFYASSTSDFYTPVGLKKEYFPISGGSGKFIMFIENELQPYIEKKYKTNTSKTIIGQSFGGLLATEILLKKPYLFDTYLIMSPSLWWDSESLLFNASDLLKTNLRNDVKVYLGVSDEGEIMKRDVKQLVEIIKRDCEDKATVIYDYIPDENHSTMVHQSIYNAIKLLYPLPKK